jgi:SAM-dependent methyltransferase
VSDQQGLRFDPVAEDYELGRAGWPPEVVEGVDGEVVLDLAAGTGKLTRLLVERFPRVIAVEPLPGMRSLLERLVPAAESLDGTAEAIPLPDASVDVAFVAEAFHWFDAGAAARELARVLRPGGVLRLVFNVWKGPFRPSIGPEARRLLEELTAKAGPGGGGKVVAGEWKRGFDSLPFTPLEERHVDHEDVADRDRAVAHLVSTSAAAALPEPERAELAGALREAIAEGDYRVEIDTHLYETRRL